MQTRVQHKTRPKLSKFQYRAQRNLFLDNFNYSDGRKSHRNLYCTNCGKNGHEFKQCDEAIISFGVILLKFDHSQIRRIFADVINDPPKDNKASVPSSEPKTTTTSPGTGPGTGPGPSTA